MYKQIIRDNLPENPSDLLVSSTLVLDCVLMAPIVPIYKKLTLTVLLANFWDNVSGLFFWSQVIR